jgi:hypothetical protein
MKRGSPESNVWPFGRQKTMFEAIANNPDGVLQWIRMRW